jgi:hypothetical protein
MRALIAAATAVLLASTSLALACGKERWPVKVAADQDVGLVASTAAPATIATLTGFAAPPNPNIRQNTRFAPAERTPVTISGILVIIKRETDQDYHLVVADPQNTGLQNPHLRMIVESPNPQCAPRSRFGQEIAQVRQAIDSHFHGPIVGKRIVRIPVTVTGIPFFDPFHGQEGIAYNGIELHPILAIQFH